MTPPPSVKDGYLAVGNRTVGAARDKVHLLCIPDVSTGIPATGFTINIPNTNDLRAVAITPTGVGLTGNPSNAIVLQARNDLNISQDHIDVLLVDASDPGTIPLIYSTY
ncbi:MAG: hypothetical protein JST27_12820 [Bacteroidetes bacterium]|nr:hypothetical protein [Bacteroidota bacterium]